MVVVSRREARTMGADEDRDPERHAEGGADHGPEHQATDEETGVPGVGHYRDRDRHPGAVPTSATCMKPSRTKRSTRSRSVSGPMD
jgi:hypothetical protein